MSMLVFLGTGIQFITKILRKEEFFGFKIITYIEYFEYIVLLYLFLEKIKTHDTSIL
jgi:hypothetical protein